MNYSVSQISGTQLILGTSNDSSPSVVMFQNSHGEVCRLSDYADRTDKSVVPPQGLQLLESGFALSQSGDTHLWLTSLVSKLQLSVEAWVHAVPVGHGYHIGITDIGDISAPSLYATFSDAHEDLKSDIANANEEILLDERDPEDLWDGELFYIVMTKETVELFNDSNKKDSLGEFPIESLVGGETVTTDLALISQHVFNTTFNLSEAV